jgi:hypothetical protein
MGIGQSCGCAWVCGALSPPVGPGAAIQRHERAGDMMLSLPGHRELVLSSTKMVSFHFCRLPHDLQDEIIQGLETNTITLDDASLIAAGRGYTLSREAISNYCWFVRKLRADFLERMAREAALLAPTNHPSITRSRED